MRKLFNLFKTHLLSEEKTIAQQNTLHGLSSVIRYLRTLEYEEHFFLDDHGGVVLRHTNKDPKRVELNSEQVDFLARHPGLTSIHNHPGSEAPPSIDDLTFAERINSKNCMVVTGNHLYEILPNGQGWVSMRDMELAVTMTQPLFKVVGERGGWIEVESTDESLLAMTKLLGYGFRKAEIME